MKSHFSLGVILSLLLGLGGSLGHAQTQQPPAPSGSTPGGTSGQAQYNTGSTLGGSAGLTLGSATITSQTAAVTASSADISPLATHNIIACDASGAARTYTLPAATAGLVGRRYRVIKVDTSTNACTVQPATGERINGTVNGTQALTAQYSEVEVVLLDSTTPNWQAIQGAKLQRYLTIECVPDATALTTGTGKCYVPIHPDFNGWNVVGSSAHVGAVVAATSGINVDVQRCGAVATGIRCSGTNVSVFSTVMTIDTNEDGTETGTAGTINAANQTLATGQWLRVDVAGTFTAAQGLYVTVVLQKP